ncbi:hypothetical protein ACSBR2_010849 [Camellia fascicularis]
MSFRASCNLSKSQIDRRQSIEPFLLPQSTTAPSGKLVQIEHALTVVGSGQTSLGIKAANGVVIATEKKLPSILADEASVNTIVILSSSPLQIVQSGMGPDSRVLVRKSRKQAEQYHRLYKEPIPVTQLVRETAAVMQKFTQSGYTDDMELDDVVHTAILTLKEGFEGQISEKNIEIGIIGTDKKFRVLTPSEIADYLEEVE